jgi:hypothetical protein
VRYHFVIVDYLCHAPNGDAVAGTDAEAVAWVTADELFAYGVNEHAAAVVRKALACDSGENREPARTSRTRL